MSKIIQEFAAKRVIFETSTSIEEVVARLDVELSKDKAGPKLFDLLKEVKTREELERGFWKSAEAETSCTYDVDASTLEIAHAGMDSSLFGSSPFHVWRNTYFGTTDAPKTYQYTFGNPVVAQPMLNIDIYATLHVPLRLLVVEKSDKSGTQIVYLLPSSVFAVPVGGSVSQELVAKAKVVDEQVERLVWKVIGD